MPVTVTASLKLTWIETRRADPVGAVGVDEVTGVTVGAVVSMTMFLSRRGEPAAPGAGSVSVGVVRRRRP